MKRDKVNKDRVVTNILSCEKLIPSHTVGLPVFIIAVALLVSFFQTIIDAGGAVNNQFEPPPLKGLPIVNDADLKVEMLFEGLRFPTSMEFLGPGDLLVTEKNNGTVQRLINWKMQEEPVLDISVATRHSRGILGISISKNIQTETDIEHDNNDTRIFVYFTRSSALNDTIGAKGEKSAGNVLYQYQLIGSRLLNPLLLLELPPKKHPDHNGGAVIVGPDANIYVSVGDGGNDTTQTQNAIGGECPNGSGGILAITQEGSSGTKCYKRCRNCCKILCVRP